MNELESPGFSRGEDVNWWVVQTSSPAEWEMALLIF